MYQRSKSAVVKLVASFSFTTRGSQVKVAVYVVGRIRLFSDSFFDFLCNLLSSMHADSFGPWNLAAPYLCRSGSAMSHDREKGRDILVRLALAIPKSRGL